MTSLLLPVSDERSVQEDLASLDEHLVLTRERDAIGRDYYVVIFYTNGTVEPTVILDWRDGDGTPRPLNSALPNEVRRQMQGGPTSVKQVMAHNQALREKREAEMAEVYEERAKEVARYERSASPPHRSRALYLARQKERERRARGGK